MFKVIRSEQPKTWSGKNYNDPILVEQLRKDFFSKCYLCEQTDFGNLNIEHFRPHKGKDSNLKLDWNNLYYACSHCNSIKGSRYEDLLDCCNDSHNVDVAIALEAPSVPSGRVKVTNTIDSNSPLFELANKTANLLDQCYNNKNSGTQAIAHHNLIEKILDAYNDLTYLRLKLKKNYDKNTEFENKQLIEKINNMVKPNYPFSAFWRHYVNSCDFLRDKINL
ncbi:HNH endonuclease [Acinetobacter baumannii]|uniref:HNH endonuclease n=1 Tax=Acinetobacter baumannii TaxID=470 RepID=UPI0025A0249C|nr:HNH endonuclease [Acinetobacter baumannii]